MILPQNGSVIIIDDNPKEALPIIKALSKAGISSAYYNGINRNELPESPDQPVRLVFLDLQLIDGITDEHQISTNLIQILKKVIDVSNGPYILVIWSKNHSKFGETVEIEIKKAEHSIAPIAIVNINKRDCLEEFSYDPIDIDEFCIDLISSFKGEFDKEDLKNIEASIRSKLHDRKVDDYQVRENAIEIIQNAISEKLQQAGIFHLFILWENLLKKSGAVTVNSISSTIEISDLWERNMRDVIKRLAKARSGRNNLTREQTLVEALTTFTNSFAEEIENGIRTANFPAYIDLEHEYILAGSFDKYIYKLKEQANDLYITRDNEELQKKWSSSKSKLDTLVTKLPKEHQVPAKKLVNTYDSIPHAINSKLHLELNPSDILMPGNVYFIDVPDDKKIIYLNTYFDNPPKENLGLFQFIELEVSPICDYAQAKWKRSRLISGLLYPSAFNTKSAEKFLYSVQPKLIIGSDERKMIFDFHLFKSMDKEDVLQRKIQFRLKRELLLDIIANLSGQINRPGISFVS